MLTRKVGSCVVLMVDLMTLAHVLIPILVSSIDVWFMSWGRLCFPFYGLCCFLYLLL